MTGPSIPPNWINAQPYYSDFAVFQGILDIMAAIHRLGYVYKLSAGYCNWPTVPPIPGTEMNCKAAAHLTKRLADEQMQLPASRLRLVGAKGVGPYQNGFFIPIEATHSYALGATRPTAYEQAAGGWEFSEHWRLEDTQTGRLFDPTFGTTGELNPVAIASVWEGGSRLFSDLTISNYGEKYLVFRRLPSYDAERIELSRGLPCSPQYHVQNWHYILT